MRIKERLGRIDRRWFHSSFWLCSPLSSAAPRVANCNIVASVWLARWLVENIQTGHSHGAIRWSRSSVLHLTARRRLMLANDIICSNVASHAASPTCGLFWRKKNVVIVINCACEASSAFSFVERKREQKCHFDQPVGTRAQTLGFRLSFLFLSFLVLVVWSLYREKTQSQCDDKRKKGKTNLAIID